MDRHTKEQLLSTWHPEQSRQCSCDPRWTVPAGFRQCVRFICPHYTATVRGESGWLPSRPVPSQPAISGCPKSGTSGPKAAAKWHQQGPCHQWALTRPPCPQWYPPHGRPQTQLRCTLLQELPDAERPPGGDGHIFQRLRPLDHLHELRNGLERVALLRQIQLRVLRVPVQDPEDRVRTPSDVAVQEHQLLAGGGRGAGRGGRPGIGSGGRRPGRGRFVLGACGRRWHASDSLRRLLRWPGRRTHSTGAVRPPGACGWSGKGCSIRGRVLRADAGRGRLVPAAGSGVGAGGWGLASTCAWTSSKVVAGGWGRTLPGATWRHHCLGPRPSGHRLP